MLIHLLGNPIKIMPPYCSTPDDLDHVYGMIDDWPEESDATSYTHFIVHQIPLPAAQARTRHASIGLPSSRSQM